MALEGRVRRGGRRARDDERPITCGQVVSRLRGGTAGLPSRSEVSKAEPAVNT